MPSSTQGCRQCEGCFSKSHFLNSHSICMLCDNRKLREERFAQLKHDFDYLTTEFSALQEFVSANVWIQDPLTAAVPSPPPNPSSFPPTTLLLLPHTPLYLIPLPPIPPTLPNSPLAPLFLIPPPIFPTVLPPLPPSQPLNRTRHSTPWGTELSRDPERHTFQKRRTTIIHNQLTEFCARSPNTRRRFCIPEASLDDVINAIDDVSLASNERTLFIIHAGNNDVKDTRSEELLEVYRAAIQKFKTLILR